MNTMEFIKQTNADAAACERMAACTTPEEAYELACGAGLTDSYEAFVETMQAVRAQVSELSEGDLENLNAAGTSTAVSTALCSASLVGLTAMM